MFYKNTTGFKGLNATRVPVKFLLPAPVVIILFWTDAIDHVLEHVTTNIVADAVDA